MPNTQAEIALAIRNLKTKKVPGTDGLPADFYKIFYGKIKDFLFDPFTEILEKGELHLSARWGIIALLEKTGRKRLFIKNWRPISLLNTDYKILAKIIAGRLQSAVMEFISETQTGLIKGRLLGEN